MYVKSVVDVGGQNQRPGRQACKIVRPLTRTQVEGFRDHIRKRHLLCKECTICRYMNTCYHASHVGHSCLVLKLAAGNENRSDAYVGQTSDLQNKADSKPHHDPTCSLFSIGP